MMVSPRTGVINNSNKLNKTTHNYNSK